MEKATCQKFKNAGFDVFCPDMIGRQPFPYEESQKVYNHFMKTVGFDQSEAISGIITQLKERYEKVTLVGFSVGATLACKTVKTRLVMLLSDVMAHGLEIIAN